MAKKPGEILVKTCLIGGFSFFIWWELFYKQDFFLLADAFLKRISDSNPIFLVLAIALVPVNWALETLKWWLLVLEFEKISFWKALKAVLIGVTIGIFTPGRIGEYGGRTYSVSPENIVESFVATFLGSVSQLLATLLFGYIGVVYFMYHFSLISPPLLWSSMVFGVASFTLTLFIFYNAAIFIDITNRIYMTFIVRFAFVHRIRKVLSSWLEHIKVLQKYGRRQLSKALFTSLIRYIVYSSQYLLLLNFMGIEMGLKLGMASTATVFLLQSSVPLPPISGLIMRAGTALYIWQYFSANQVAILSTTFCLWLLNVILPASAGLFLLLSTDIFRKNDK